MGTMKPSGDNAEVRHEVVSLVDDLLASAIRAGASDVHFEPTGEALAVRFRLDGVLQTVETLPAALSENLVARLKVLAGLLTYRNDVPQEGRLDAPAAVADSVADLRLAVFPTVRGQRAVVRVLYQQTGLERLEALGLPASAEGRLRQFAAGRGGLLLVTGPAGTGKSTTLAALLGHIARHTPGRSIVSVEDPVERRIDGVTQIQIAPHGELTFPVALRSLLRQDPEVLMIGEIRDAETARIVVEAGLTGHLMMSTLHSATPAAALLRLLEMGIEPYQVTSAVTAVLSQRLVRTLCPACKQPAGGGGSVPVGCEACMQTGFRGRALLAELVELDGRLRQGLLDRADAEALETMIDRRGQMTLAQHGKQLLAEGVTCPAELAAVLPAETER